jgi:hypothetical protein
LSRKFFIASETLDHERLAGADWPAKQVAHRQGGEVARFPERDVLAQPVFDGGLAVKVFERAIGFDELDESLRVLFNKLFFQGDQIMRCEFPAVVLTGLQQGFDGMQRGPGKRGGGL